ncbi:hypothetical protein OG943_16660 [Amycolatopsis sp. NBC_00345]|uniref:hypothetical protein n=1 Tax=Amycolatopsis sp. NBC_00345 TaxID=2975955 RepID=UPI002E2756F4
MSPFRQALLILRWFRDAIPVHRLALDHHISVATAYHYLHEAITGLAARDLDITGALTAAASQGLRTLADRAHHSAGIGILTPFKPQVNHRSQSITRPTACSTADSAASANAPPPSSKTRWPALQRMSFPL